MRSSLLAFSVYLSLLSLLPCGDGGYGIGHLLNEAFAIEHSHDNHSDGPCEDGCSPFCICECCSIPIPMPSETLSLEVAERMEIQENIVGAVSLYQRDFTGFVWHPPSKS